jgi:hypothetical protein
MRVEKSRNGCVVSVDDTNDMIVVEAVITAFTPARGDLRCNCGADSRRSDVSAADDATLICGNCHRTIGNLAAYSACTNSRVRGA